MTEENAAPVLETTATIVTAPTQAEPAPEQKTFSADYVKSLREEAAASRVQLREAQKAIESLQKTTEASAEMKAQLDTLQKDLAEKTAAAERAAQEALLLRYAVKAGVDPDVAAMIDLSKVDLSDEAKAIATLAKLASAGRSQTQAKPGAIGNTGMTPAELREWAFGGGNNKSSIFGG